MLQWLRRHRQALLDGLQNVVPAILDHLVDKEHIDPLRSLVYQEIMLDTTAPLQKARKLLDWLSSRPPAVFWAFQHAIRQDRTEAIHRLTVCDDEMRELMEFVKGMSLPKKLGLMSPAEAVLKARKELQKFYLSRDELLMSAGLAKGKTMPMDKILVNICLLSSEEAKKALEDPSFASERDQRRSEYLFSKILQHQPSLLSLEEVFQAKQEGERAPNKIVASGGAGSGKSTCFTRKAPYEWALEKLWKQFALLFCLELRDKSVWKAKTLAELLKLVQLGLSVEEQEEVRLFITNHPDQVAIVCDGLDKGFVDEDCFLWSLLKGNCVGVPSSLRMVVTTRPCKAASEVSQSISYRGVEVVGFTKEELASFVHQYLGKEKGARLLTQLDKRPSIASLMHVPLFCLMICDLFQQDQDLPSRGTEVFEKVVVTLLRCYSKAHGFQASFQGISKAPPELRELILSLGKVAYEGLQKKQMYFTQGELENAGLPTDALQLGLLMKQETAAIFKEDEFAFSHLTLQEFLSAFYMSGEVLQTRADVAKLLENVSLLDGHLSTFWVFLAGLLRADMVEDLLQALDPEQIVVGKSYLMLTLFRCYAESCLARRRSQSASIGKILKGRSVDFFWHSLSALDCMAISTVLQSHTESKEVCTVNMSGCSMTDAGLAHLLPGLHCCKSIQGLDLTDNALTRRLMSEVGVILAANARTLIRLSLGGNGIGDDGLEKLAESIDQCKRLKSLSLFHAGLTSRSGLILGDIAAVLPHLQTLDISQNDLRDIGFQQMAGGLHICTLPKASDNQLSQSVCSVCSDSQQAGFVNSVTGNDFCRLEFHEGRPTGAATLNRCTWTGILVLIRQQLWKMFSRRN